MQDIVHSCSVVKSREIVVTLRKDGNMDSSYVAEIVMLVIVSLLVSDSVVSCRIYASLVVLMTDTHSASSLADKACRT